MKPFRERALRALEASSESITTIELRALLEISASRFTRLRKLPGFPSLIRDGRRLLVLPLAVAAWARERNRIAAGLPLSLVAAHVKLTRRTVRSLINAGQFPKPIGIDESGRARWSADAIAHWQRARLRGELSVGGG